MVAAEICLLYTNIICTLFGRLGLELFISLSISRVNSIIPPPPPSRYAGRVRKVEKVSPSYEALAHYNLWGQWKWVKFGNKIKLQKCFCANYRYVGRVKWDSSLHSGEEKSEVIWFMGLAWWKQFILERGERLEVGKDDKIKLCRV